MNKMLMKRVIIDIDNHGADETHLPALVDCFESLMAKAAGASCRRAYYELADLTLASQRGLGDYALDLERLTEVPGHNWVGCFSIGGRLKLKVMGCLEAC